MTTHPLDAPPPDQVPADGPTPPGITPGRPGIVTLAWALVVLTPQFVLVTLITFAVNVDAVLVGDAAPYGLLSAIGFYGAVGSFACSQILLIFARRSARSRGDHQLRRDIHNAQTWSVMGTVLVVGGLIALVMVFVGIAGLA